MRKSLIFMLISALLICPFASGCTPAAPGGDGTTAPAVSDVTTAPVNVGLVNIVENGQVKYAVVRSETARDYVRRAASAVYNTLGKLGHDADIRDDWERELDPAGDVIAAQYEILIGATNRPESSSDIKIGNDEYIITVSGNKILVLGGSDIALGAGCTALVGLIEAATPDADGKISLDLSTPVTGKTDLKYLVAVTDQKNASVRVYDLLGGSINGSDALWSQKYSAANIADTRLRLYNDIQVVLAAYGSTSASMVDYATGNVLWSTESAASNPHACELIPGSATGGEGVIAVASSSGGQVRFFDVSSNGVSYMSVNLPDAHGVLWDPGLGVVWAQGLNVLTAYTVKLQNGLPVVKERTDLRYTIPTTNSHDLQPCYGDTDKLWITTGAAVYLFSKSTGTFSTDYPGYSTVNRSNVKSIGNFDDGSIVFIVPDGAFYSWTSASFVFCADNDGVLSPRTYKSDDGGFYKVRVWNENYQ